MPKLFVFTTFLMLVPSALSLRGRAFKKCEFNFAKFNHGQRHTGINRKTCECEDGKWMNCDDNPALNPANIRYDFPTRQQFRDQFNPLDFVFDLKGKKPSRTAGGSVRVGNVEDVPALYGEGISAALFTLEPCAVNLPHVHPHATELLYVINGDEGKFLQTAFVEPNGGRTIVNKIGVGEVTFFPEGLLHYQQNFGCKRMQFFSALNSPDPGVSTMTFAFASLPDEAIRTSFGLEGNEVSRLVSGLPEGPAQGQRQCWKKCGLDMAKWRDPTAAGPSYTGTFAGI